jgi:hypothetical protein
MATLCDKEFPMTFRDGFHEHYAEELLGLYDCPDRLVFLAYNQYLQRGGGFRLFWRALHGGDESGLTSGRVADMAGDMVRRLHAFCDKSGIPLLDAAAGDRKGEDAKAYIPQDPAFTGLFLVQKSLAPAPVWHVERYGKGNSVIKLYRPRKWRNVRHAFFHIMDPDWGHVTIRMCCHPPFGAMVILNGHEWTRRRAEKCGVAFRTDGNCFIEGSDIAGLDSLGGKLTASAADVQKVADRWIYSSCLCFGLPTPRQEVTGFKYEYSVLQIEYSRNYVFKRGSSLDQIYQCLLDRARGALGLERLKTILGFKHRPHNNRPEIAITRSCDAKGCYDLTTLSIIWGDLKLKIYDKSGRLLRAEVTVNNAKALRCARSLGNIPEVMERLRAVLDRFMNHIQSVNIAFIGPDDLIRWAQPGRAGGHRTAGINLNNARVRSVLSLLPSLSTAPGGFSSADLQERVRANGGPRGYTISQARYDLRKLRGKGLVRRPPHRRKYEIPAKIAGKVRAYFTISDEVIRPILASCGRRRRGPKPQHPVDTIRMRMRDDLVELFAELGIAAA